MSAAWVVAQETLPSAGGVNPAPQPPASGSPAAPAAPSAAQQPPTDARHYSYAIGWELGKNFRSDKLPLDADSLLAGLRDGLQGVNPRYAPELCQLSLERLSEQRAQAMDRRNQEYLVENAKAQGVQTTASGLQYKVIKAGQGATPTAKDTVLVHYRGQLVDGTVFDESYGGDPAPLPVAHVIPGWSEALQQMKVGDKWQLVIPAKLAYGDQGAGGVIPPNSTLVFDVELLGIQEK
ncbi:MAG: FKBP-type peptidyl-prolyl cis-trans isomerase [Pirellulales bacterium]|nr:FKBP-type peptidyl-prolyl cis-trans isomerase [Pirellulales bacterium]